MYYKNLNLLVILIYLISSSSSYSIERPDIKNLIIHNEKKKIDNVDFFNSTNKKISLSNYKSKVVIINFWATWCAPCKEEMPHLDKLKAKFKNLEIIPINIADEELTKSKEFFEELNIYNLEIFYGPSIELAKQFKLRGIPTTVIIDKEGYELARIIGYIDFEKANDQIFSIVRNYKLYHLLKNNLSKNKYFNSKLITIKNLSFINKYDLVINCDPVNIIAKKYFNKKFEKKYNSKAYTTIITHEKILNNTAVQIFTNRGPLAFLPISDTQTSVVYSIPDVIYKTKENIKKLIRDKNIKYKIKNIEEINNFELKFLNLREYYHNNIIAFGDLLHKIHPLAGQGFNMTIRDIRETHELIEQKKRYGLDLDISICSNFEKKTRNKNYIFSNGIDLIYEFFNFENKIESNIPSKIAKFIGKNKFANKFFRKIADKGLIT